MADSHGADAYRGERMVVERYRLTLTHDIILDDNVTVSLEEPKTFEHHNIDVHTSYDCTYRNHVLDEMFNRFLSELKRESEE